MSDRDTAPIAARGRLTALRLVGFKSFADRTVVEFGPGISAVIGPNGSGKSNLADALRWTLGEQGRLLRTRRAEDVIFAGSSARRAIGMADVTLVIDNSDRLLPLDYGEVELGRRLYRSGENEYLLNRQRVRLRDLVELLDAGNLADNAFLFIGQGMVDQALALRPEERRPLFEEVAGVRRHERRRRQAEAELAEAEANLERLRDLLAELRPQARRLAAQAEQLAARQSAGAELAEAVLAAARARWLATAATARQEQDQLEHARAAADAALNELRTAEAEAAAVSAAIGRQAEVERAKRNALDEERARLAELRVSAARFDSEGASLARERARTQAERGAADQRAGAARRVLSGARPPSNSTVAVELEQVEHRLAETATELSVVVNDQAALRQLAALSAEARARRVRVDELTASLAEHRSRLATLERDATRAAEQNQQAVAALDEAARVIEELEAGAGTERRRLDSANAAAQLARLKAAEADMQLAGARAELSGLEAEVHAGQDDGLVRAARARGAQLLAEGLEVEPGLVAAVGALLGSWAAAYVVDAAAAIALAGRRGNLVLDDAGRRPGSSAAAQAQARSIFDAAGELGGGALADAIRRDPGGVVTRLAQQAVWVPSLEAALSLRTTLGAGWRAVTVNGEVVGDEGLVSLASGESQLERRRLRDAAAARLTELEGDNAGARAEAGKRESAAAEAREALRALEETRGAARRQVRLAEDAERSAQGRHEQAQRELTWLRSRVEAITDELGMAEESLSHAEGELAELQQARPAPSPEAQLAAAQALRAGLEARRDELRRAHAEEQAAYGRWEDARRRADVGLALDEARLAELTAEERRLLELETQLGARREQLATQLAQHEMIEQELARELHAVLGASAGERERLAGADRQASAARDRLRVAEQTSRRLELAAIEHRLQLEQQREQLLVELAGIGADGQRALFEAATAGSDIRDDLSAEQMEEMLSRLTEAWLAANDTVVAPTSGRLATLRRRFHDLGAGNPYALEESAEVNSRLETLDAQRDDLETAIRSTRELIASLSELITEQFRSTFAALEGAFARRFHELFGGGEAQLSLTDPQDLSATGVEIHARPPGKKRQPLSMLSGGERALTAVSLLLAMLEVRPVPFCVLDEVDAALDEANIGRFSRALRGLSEHTQFIVITHNRGTIEGADALYGVTLGEDAVSRIVSLRLPEPAVEEALA